MRIVKIDRSFVERLGTEDDFTPVVKAIIEMSHAMGLRVVAEGVISARLQPLVAALGCKVTQGFFWAEPTPAPEFADWWRAAQRLTGAWSRSGARCHSCPENRSQPQCRAMPTRDLAA